MFNSILNAKSAKISRKVGNSIMVICLIKDPDFCLPGLSIIILNLQPVLKW